MANPRYQAYALGVSLANSFTTSFEVLNYSQAAVQVVWSGLDAVNANMRLRASNDGVNFQNLTTNPITMTVSGGNHIYNLYSISYAYLQVYLDPVSATTGSVEIHILRKSFA